MRTRMGAMVAAIAAAVSAAAAAVWAKRRRSGKAVEREVPATTGTSPSGPDDLTIIKGLGTKSVERLADLGVTKLAQIAAWTDADIDEIAPRIRVGAERIRHEDWVGQARDADKR